MEERILLKKSIGRIILKAFTSVLLILLSLFLFVGAETATQRLVLALLGGYAVLLFAFTLKGKSNKEIVINAREILIPYGKESIRINMFALDSIKYQSQARIAGGGDFTPDKKIWLEFISRDGDLLGKLPLPYFQEKRTFREFLTKLRKINPDLVMDDKLSDFLNGDNKAVELNKMISLPMIIFGIIGFLIVLTFVLIG